MRSAIARATIVGSLCGVATAMQPGAVAPKEAPMRNLSWGDLNFLHTTDTHGWLGGHLLEHQYGADWGDYISFAEHMHKKADEANTDLLLVDTGDRVEGNGIYDGSDPKGKYIYPIYQQQDIDIICIGNHELYKAFTADQEQAIQVPHFSDRYIASNLDYVDPESGERMPFAQRYRHFKTKNRGFDIVAMGFIFDFTGNQNNTVVTKVEDAIKEDWFQEAIRLKPDVFVVIGHIGLRMAELKDIYTAIRKQNWHIPIVFFAGHAHVRDALKFDKGAFAMASGRYFETVGWMSLDGLEKKEKDEVDAEKVPWETVKFQRRYLDNNLWGYRYHTGLNETEFPTEKGLYTSKLITKARRALRLDELLGCAPKSLWMNRVPIDNGSSIYDWFSRVSMRDIMKNEERKDMPFLGYLNTGAIRFDIVKGKFTADSLYNVSPFTSGIVGIKDVPYSIAQKIIHIINGNGPIFTAEQSDMPDIRMLGQPESWSLRPETLETSETRPLELRSEQHVLSESNGFGDNDNDNDTPLTAGYTTKDDIGEDGDDTIHTKMSFYNVPNAIVSEGNFPEGGEPEMVDVVFLDFLKPWVLSALKFLGREYDGEKDVVGWGKETFSEELGKWIVENWKGEC